MKKIIPEIKYLICDRCGKSTETEPRCFDRGYSNTVYDSYSIQKRRCNLWVIGSTSPDEIDLCSMCHQKLVEFMDNKPVKLEPTPLSPEELAEREDDE